MAMSTTTKLMAVNTILSTVGEAPVNNLTSVTADVRIAESVLDEVSREIQSAGWHFNTEKEVQLPPDSTGQVNLASNIVRVDLEDANIDSDFDIVIRGTKLYNRKSHTYTFTKTLKYTTVALMEWDYMPEPAKRYIMIRSARIYQDRMLGSEKISAFTRGDEMAALVTLRQFEMDTADYSVFDNYDVARIVDRDSVIDRLDRG
jgi:hypothetical protein